MISERKLAANRLNAMKSTGPKTEAGKAVASRNAVRHGMYATAPLLPEESAAEFDAFRAALADDLEPAGPMQEVLFDRIAALAWKLRRMPEVENWIVQLIGETEREKSQRRNAARPRISAAEAMAMHFMAHDDAFDQLSQYEQRLQRGIQAALRQLLMVQKGRGQGAGLKGQGEEKESAIVSLRGLGEASSKWRNEATESRNSLPGQHSSSPQSSPRRHGEHGEEKEVITTDEDG